MWIDEKGSKINHYPNVGHFVYLCVCVRAHERVYFMINVPNNFCWISFCFWAKFTFPENWVTFCRNDLLGRQVRAPQMEIESSPFFHSLPLPLSVRLFSFSCPQIGKIAYCNWRNGKLVRSETSWRTRKWFTPGDRNSSKKISSVCNLFPL